MVKQGDALIRTAELRTSEGVWVEVLVYDDGDVQLSIDAEQQVRMILDETEARTLIELMGGPR